MDELLEQRISAETSEAQALQPLAQRLELGENVSLSPSLSLPQALMFS
jgi:hypothetical protein